jgi:hypothetical protein
LRTEQGRGVTILLVRVIYAAIAIFLVGAAGGCRKGAESHVDTVPPAELPAGWSYAKSSDGAVSIAVPPGWRAGADTAANSITDMTSNLGGSSLDNQPPTDTPDNGEMQKLAQSLAQEDKRAEQKAMAELEAKGIILNVLNGSRPIPGEKRTRFYVERSHGTGTAYAQDAVASEQTRYAHMPKPTVVSLPIGKAVRLSADDSLIDGMTLHQTSYIVVDANDTYTLRFVTEEAPESIQRIEDAVAKSLRIAPAH